MVPLVGEGSQGRTSSSPIIVGHFLGAPNPSLPTGESTGLGRQTCWFGLVLGCCRSAKIRVLIVSSPFSVTVFKISKDKNEMGKNLNYNPESSPPSPSTPPAKKNPKEGSIKLTGNGKYIVKFRFCNVVMLIM